MIEKQPLLLNQWGLRLNNWLLTFDGMVLNLMDELGRLQKPCLKGMLILNSFSFLSVSKSITEWESVYNGYGVYSCDESL